MFEVETDDRVAVVDVTDRVADEVPADASGVCTVFVPHTTAGVVVNEAESGLLTDLEAHLERVAPSDRDYRHDRIDDNAAAHLRAVALGESVSVPVEGGDLALGTWQSVLFVDCDGPRTRRVEVAVADAV
ncbi:secondary thiamine-phosphate synthase enzyme YjbQ [Halorussus salilacus]|uniref:secondary thiamine-phosphate synthase enzyme YjbQ n=1 Tax=Halorussus salilacus TaxID=2953750 RepID=UPI00209DB6E2|nr:secondary thiamine-phosphate synthase enzyme YjbQ [Halorussus salilacus]USZ67787.1 secondary thiamine-phosphate synthase enzyme YjbQ [Halorussus salilacus]